MEQETIKNMIANAQNIAIFPNKLGGVDAFSAGVGLYYMLKKLEKNVALVYQGKRPEGCESLIRDDEILNDCKQRELVVAIDYSGTPASKVHYYTENDTLYLSVSPVNREFDLSKIKSKIKGYDYDLIITIGAQGVDDFGQFYRELEEEFNTTPIINIDNTERNQRFGKVNVIDSLEHSLSLVVLNNSMEFGTKPNAQAAKALLTGISSVKM
jgi:nanoRNase/pAp phosphatase (c-di-AMP/oligoRNAs hydrolase)